MMILLIVIILTVKYLAHNGLNHHYMSHDLKMTNNKQQAH